jgi:CheY-like chemotaxis protein
MAGLRVTLEGTEAIQKINGLRPDMVVLDLHMPDIYVGPTRFSERLNGTKVVAITSGKDAVAEALAEHIGADTLIDKADLTTKLIPTILRLAAKGS